jgi:hypothetical protein
LPFPDLAVVQGREDVVREDGVPAYGDFVGVGSVHGCFRGSVFARMAETLV